jgi:hypothetical protein
MAKIYKANEAMLATTLTGLIYGDGGCGKTTLAGTAHATLILDSDQGAYRALHRPDTLAVRSWQDILDVVEDDAVMAEYETIVIDTVGTALNFLEEAVQEKTSKNGNGAGGLSPQGWGVLKNEFQSFISRLRVKNKNILFVAHAKEEKEGDARYYRPDIQGGSKDMIYRLCDYIGYAHRTNADTRCVDFSCVEKALVKDTAGLGKVTVPNLLSAQPYFATLMTKMLDGINGKTAAQQQAVMRIAEFRATAEALTAVGDFNAHAAELNAMLDSNRAVAIQCKRILDQRATSLGMAYKKESKQYGYNTESDAKNDSAMPETTLQSAPEKKESAPQTIAYEELLARIPELETLEEFNTALQEARVINKSDAAQGKQLKAALDLAAGEYEYIQDPRTRWYVYPQTAEVEKEESVW